MRHGLPWAKYTLVISLPVWIHDIKLNQVNRQLHVQHPVLNHPVHSAQLNFIMLIITFLHIESIRVY